MPTKIKTEKVKSIGTLLNDATCIVSADYTGESVDTMTELRRALREKGVNFKVIKNSLTYIAADEIGKPGIKDIIQGPTGLAIGFKDPLDPAKTICEFIDKSGANITIRGGLLGDQILSADEVQKLAKLPSKDQLISQLMSQLQGPVTSLVYVLNGPISSLARVLQRKIESSSKE